MIAMSVSILRRSLIARMTAANEINGGVKTATYRMGIATYRGTSQLKDKTNMAHAKSVSHTAS
jgi:hypothetical protein